MFHIQLFLSTVTLNDSKLPFCGFIQSNCFSPGSPEILPAYVVIVVIAVVDVNPVRLKRR
jgi:hypothetical protein